MIFEALSSAAERGELILVEGGLCHWHLRKDGQLTIREILVLPECRRRGIGTAMLAQLKEKGATSIFAKCPLSLTQPLRWYRRQGFVEEGREMTRSGKTLVLLRLSLGD